MVRRSWGILVSMRSLAPEAWGEVCFPWKQELGLSAELIQCGDVVGHSLASAMQLYEVNTPGATPAELWSSIIFLPTSGGVSELCTSPDCFRPEGVHVRYQCLFSSVLQQTGEPLGGAGKEGCQGMVSSLGTQPWSGDRQM